MVPLDPARIVETGLRVLDDHGFDQLSLRRIADELGVQTPALYWHIRDREELYGLMAEAMLREALAAVDAALIGRGFLVALGRSLHNVHMRRRDAAKLIALAKPTQASQGELGEMILGKLAAGGIRRVAEAVTAVYSFTLGWSLFRTNPSVEAALARRMNVGDAFEVGLEALAAGFDRQA